MEQRSAQTMQAEVHPWSTTIQNQVWFLLRIAGMLTPCDHCRARGISYALVFRQVFIFSVFTMSVLAQGSRDAWQFTSSVAEQQARLHLELFPPATAEGTTGFEKLGDFFEAVRDKYKDGVQLFLSNPSAEVGTSSDELFQVQVQTAFRLLAEGFQSRLMFAHQFADLGGTFVCKTRHLDSTSCVQLLLQLFRQFAEVAATDRCKQRIRCVRHSLLILFAASSCVRRKARHRLRQRVLKGSWSI